MSNERSIDELIGTFNARAQAEGRYDSRAFWEVPARLRSIHDIPETDKSKEDLAWFRARRLAKQKALAASEQPANSENLAGRSSHKGKFEPCGLVRIRQLLGPTSDYNGWRVNQRPPRVGDVGTLLDVLQAHGLPDRYVVESSDENGITIWLADFTAEELEPLPD
jgi:hypothetical protein